MKRCSDKPTLILAIFLAIGLALIRLPNLNAGSSSISHQAFEPFNLISPDSPDLSLPDDTDREGEEDAEETELALTNSASSSKVGLPTFVPQF